MQCSRYNLSEMWAFMCDWPTQHLAGWCHVAANMSLVQHQKQTKNVCVFLSFKDLKACFLNQLLTMTHHVLHENTIFWFYSFTWEISACVFVIAFLTVCEWAELTWEKVNSHISGHQSVTFESKHDNCWINYLGCQSNLKPHAPNPDEAD